MNGFKKHITTVGWGLASHHQNKKQIHKNIALAMVFVLLFPILSAAAVKIPDTRSISLYKIDGSSDGVSITRGAKKTFKGAEGTKLAENDALTTDAKTTAYLSIDEDKTVKLDKNTKVTVSKASSAKLRITLVSGNLYFDVKKPLPESGSLEFKAGGTVMGVRGTDGVFSHVAGQVSSIIFSGNITLTVTPPPGSPLGAAPITIVINAGEFQIINSDGVPQGTPQKIDLQTMPSFVLETIIEKITENPASAEEAVKIEQLKEIFNIKTDADITAIKEQAEQTKAVEDQKQEQQQKQIEQTTTQLDQGSQENPPAPPSGGAASGGGGSGNNNTPQTPSVNVSTFEELVAALIRTGELNIVLTENLDITLGGITSETIAQSEYEPGKNILGGMSMGGPPVDGWINIPQDKNVIVPNSVSLIIDEKVRFHFLQGPNSGAGGGKITVNAGGIYEDWILDGQAVVKTVIIGAGQAYIDKTVLFNLNSGSAFIGAMPTAIYDPIVYDGVMNPISGSMKTSLWVYLDGNATLESIEFEDIFSYIIVNSGKLSTKFSMGQSDTFKSAVEVRGTFEVASASTMRLSLFCPISVASGATFNNNGTLEPLEFARIKVFNGGTVTGVEGITGYGPGTFEWFEEEPGNGAWQKINNVPSVSNVRFELMPGSNIPALTFTSPADTSNIKEYQVKFANNATWWTTTSYNYLDMTHVATWYDISSAGSITIGNPSVTSVAIVSSGLDDTEVMANTTFAITVAGSPLDFTAGITGTSIDITGAGITSEPGISYVVQFKKADGSKTMTVSYYPGMTAFKEQGIVDDTEMYEGWTLQPGDAVKVWKVTNMSESGFTITPFGEGQLIMLR